MQAAKKLKYLIFNALAFVPDDLMLRFQYWVKFHRKLELKNPKRFSDIIQWYKIFWHDPVMLQCTDKYNVRSFVEKRGCGKYLNTLYQVVDKADDIDFGSLPEKFVIKTTDGGNGDNIVICSDKTKLNIPETIKLVNSWRHKHYERLSREWAYAGAKQAKVIVEKYIEDPDSNDGSIDDYKFLCYDGKFRFLWIDKDRFSNHRRGFWNERLEFLQGVSSDHPTFDNPPMLPENIHEMVEVAEKLSAGFPFARIDLYNVRGGVIFGEITFYPMSGYAKYTPDSFDYELGKYFKFPRIKRNILLTGFILLQFLFAFP